MAHEERMIPIGYVAEARLNAWEESHANFQNALSGEGVKEHVKGAREGLIEWANKSEILEDILTSYIGETEEDFSMLARHYLARRFADAIANGLIFEDKSLMQVESETIFNKEWIYQMVVEHSKGIKRKAAADMTKMEVIIRAIFGGFDHYEQKGQDASGESSDDDSEQSGCVKPPYTM